MLFAQHILVGALLSICLTVGSAQRQSPINIVHGATLYDATLGTINITGSADAWEIKNDCKGAKLTPFNSNYSFTQMPEGQQFNLLQWHIHWRGSEHQLNGRYYPAEIHLVHQSASNSSQLAVIGFFIEAVDLDNENMEPLIDQLTNVTDCNNKVNVNNFDLGSYLPLNIDRFYRYPGSLTTPAFDETVEWYVVESPTIVLSEAQILKFQMLKDMSGAPILSNFRGLQDLNGRIPRRTWDQFLQLAERAN